MASRSDGTTGTIHTHTQTRPPSSFSRHGLLPRVPFSLMHLVVSYDRSLQFDEGPPFPFSLRSAAGGVGSTGKLFDHGSRKRTIPCFLKDRLALRWRVLVRKAQSRASLLFCPPSVKRARAFHSRRAVFSSKNRFLLDLMCVCSHAYNRRYKRCFQQILTRSHPCYMLSKYRPNQRERSLLQQ